MTSDRHILNKYWPDHWLYTVLCTQPSSSKILLIGSSFKYLLRIIHVFNKHLLRHFKAPEQRSLLLVRNKHIMCILSRSGFSRGSRTPYWGLEQSPSWMPASSRKGKSSGGEGPAGPWHRDGHRVRSENRTSRPEKKLHIWFQCCWFYNYNFAESWIVFYVSAYITVVSGFYLQLF